MSYAKAIASTSVRRVSAANYVETTRNMATSADVSTIIAVGLSHRRADRRERQIERVLLGVPPEGLFDRGETLDHSGERFCPNRTQLKAGQYYLSYISVLVEQGELASCARQPKLLGNSAIYRSGIGPRIDKKIQAIKRSQRKDKCLLFKALASTIEGLEGKGAC